jgi:hypothetical protein
MASTTKAFSHSFADFSLLFFFLLFPLFLLLFSGGLPVPQVALGGGWVPDTSAAVYVEETCEGVLSAGNPLPSLK